MLNDDNYIKVECMEYDTNNMSDNDINFEMNDCNSEDIIISRNFSSTMPDSLSNMTFSSLDNEYESTLYDCLSLEPSQRSRSQIDMLIQLFQSIPDFMCVNISELEGLCLATRLLIIDHANQIIIRKCSTLCEWFFCLEGYLRRENGDKQILGPGSIFGIDLWNVDTLISDYDLFSNTDNCKLLVISNEDLKSINSRRNCPKLKLSDSDKSVIAVYEQCTKVSNDTQNNFLTKATPEELTLHLLSNDRRLPEDFAEDFFLTHKLFLNSTKSIRNDIINSIYSENEYSEHKFNTFISWISECYPVFEKSTRQLSFVNKLISILTTQNNNEWLCRLYECCSNSSKVRDIIETIALDNYVAPVKISEHQTLFYIHNFTDIDMGLHNGDVIIELDGNSNEAITMEMIASVSNEKRPIVISVKNDMLGYHEHVLKDISMDSVSVHSTPSNARYSHSLSDKMSDATSLSTNDSDSIYIPNGDISTSLQKRPSIIPSFISSFQTGTMKRFFKNPKHYTKSTLVNNSRSNSDVTTRFDILQNGNRDLIGSTFSIPRFSRRFKSKRQRCSVGSNPDLIKSFDDLEVCENFTVVDSTTPIRIYLKDAFINSIYHASTKTDLRFVHILIEPHTTVNDIIVMTLLNLNLISASSNEFFLVEVKVNESNGIHEKILNPNTSNLINRLREHCRFYLKHRSFAGASLVLQSEADKMKEEFKVPCLLQMSTSSLVIRLFLANFKRFCQLQSTELIDHVTNNKATLKYCKGSIKSASGIFEYMHQSDFYKYWVITEVCAEDGNITTRALTIQYFIQLALKAITIGHLDLFFSLLSGLDSVEVTKLSQTWDKVSKRDKKLLENLRLSLDVSGNMRNLRIIHQEMKSPLIPVTAMTIKDLTMLEETQPTFISGTINGHEVNRNLVNFDKMSRMARLARTFVNASCSCTNDKCRPVKKHTLYCKSKIENRDCLERLLQRRLANPSDNYFLKMLSDSNTDKRNRKYSFPNISMHLSSTESVSDSVNLSEEKSKNQIFEQLMMTLKIERYLRTLTDGVIIDQVKLSEMSLACEPNNQCDGNSESKIRYSTKSIKPNDLVTVELRKESNMDNISEKAAEILGLKEKSKIHKYKPSQLH